MEKFAEVGCLKLWQGILLFFVGSFLIALLYADEILLTAAVILVGIATLAIDKWKNVKHFFVAMAVGGTCENLAVALGGWSYANAGFLFTPLWLPIGWGLSVVVMDELLGKRLKVNFTWVALGLAFAGAAFASLLAPDEGLLLAAFSAVTLLLFRSGFYKKQEIAGGVVAAIMGTAMETISILAGNWEYTAAVFLTPIWLPLCWFNAFLIMRRVMRAFD